MQLNKLVLVRNCIKRC